MKLKSINPHDQSVVGEVEVATKADVKAAVKKARKAFESWQETPIEKRAAYVAKFSREYQKQKPELAKLSTLEMGKPLSQSIDDIKWDKDYLDYYSQQGPKILKEEIIQKTKKRLRKVVREPIGVCAVITPWNFPFGMPIWGIMPNLIAGNAVVFKPSEETPLCGQKLVDILKKVGLPEGVVNIVHGDGQVGATLVDAEIDFVWFTGSSRVGQEIYQKCGKKFIRCLLELGGSSPAIIFPDADLESAVDNVWWGRFSNCGQVCSAIKRVFVHQKVFPEFVQKLVKRAKAAKVGPPLRKADLGPLVSKKQLALLEAQVKDAVKKGARVEIGGCRPEYPSLARGNYFLPTILTKANFKMRALTEEVFGPVLPIVAFSDTAQAVKMANQTPYGLTAEVYTQNLALARKVARQLQAGTVSVNSNDYFSPQCPFGGYKKSGLGREGGHFGFEELTQIKYICENLA
jgi:betaine-aldehyde dehydrogenase